MTKEEVKKKWRFEVYAFDKKTREVKFKEKSITKPLTESEFEQALKKRLASYKDPVCYKLGSW